jgi:hypothetical protein
MDDPARAWLEQKSAHCAEAQHSDDAFITLACGPGAVPSGAIALVPVEIYPNAVVRNAIMPGQRAGQNAQGRLGSRCELAVFGGQTRFVNNSVVHPATALLEWNGYDKPVQQCGRRASSPAQPRPTMFRRAAAAPRPRTDDPLTVRPRCTCRVGPSSRRLRGGAERETDQVSRRECTP